MNVCTADLEIIRLTLLILSELIRLKCLMPAIICLELMIFQH